MKDKSLGSLDINLIAHLSKNDSEPSRKGDFTPVIVTGNPIILTEEAARCVQSFVDATCVDRDRAASEGLLYWWDSWASIIVAGREKEIN